MNRIRLLPDHVANQIAAGEVVERPASVVKELVENALDAQAARVTVEIQAGGRSLVRVTDDGVGMSRDDALLSLERHATSKIQRAEDLAAIADVGNVEVDNQRVVFEYASSPERAAALLADLVQRKIPVCSFAPNAPGLEEAYLRTGIRQVD